MLFHIVGFRGRTRPNLLRQESTSLICALRILYQMLADQNRWKDKELIETRLTKLVSNSLNYFVSLSSEIHRDSWMGALLLMFTGILQLPTDQVSMYVYTHAHTYTYTHTLQFKHHVSVHYEELCSLLTMELKIEVRRVLYTLFVRIGHEFPIIEKI